VVEHQAFLGSLGAGRSSEYDLDQVVDKVCRERELSDPQHRAAVAEAYKLSRRYLAPFIVSVVVERLLPHLKEDLARDPSAKVVFLGRDGHSLARAVAGLDSEFFNRYCVEVTLPRHLIEAAVQDREQNAGFSFPEIESFRSLRHRVDPAEVPNADWRLTADLQKDRVPVDYPNNSFILVNTGFRGTAQELLAALYPQNRFRGEYLWFREMPDDPHPGSKRGLLLDLRSDRGRDRQEPLDPGLERAFARQELIAVVEATLSGPFDSPEQIVDGRTRQRPLHLVRSPLDGLNPTLVAEPYRHPMVREAARDAMLLAISHEARWIEALRSSGGSGTDVLDRARRLLPEAVEAWARGKLADLRLAGLLDSFVPRAGRAEIRRIAAAIGRARLPDGQAEAIWQDVNRLRSVPELSAYADRLESDAGVWRAVERAHLTVRSLSEGGHAPGRETGLAGADDLDPPVTDRRDGSDGRRRQC
jgi:hypothetical protein